MAKWKRYSLDFKRGVVEQMRACDNVKALAAKLKLHRNLMYQWKRQLEGPPLSGRSDLRESPEASAEKKLRDENRLLKEVLGQKSLEVDFFAGALRRVEELRRKSSASGESASTSKSGSGASPRKAN